MERRYYSFEQLRKIMARLRGPGGCPWDREQTHESIKDCLLEEAWEFLEAIETDDSGHMKEELGDLLLQVVFHAQMADEAGHFTLDEVIDSISEKLVRRHPHVFGEVEVSGSAEVLRNWEAIKGTESGKEHRKSRMDGVPRAFPALMRAQKLQGRAAKDGFDWPGPEPVWGKIEEEIVELRHEVEAGDAARTEEELGDLLFSVVNLSRKLGVPAEAALQRACRKFEQRYRSMEDEAARRGQKMSDLDLAGQDVLWEAVKGREAGRHEG